MSGFVIATDSSCDLNYRLLDKWNVPLVSIHFTIGGETYKDDCGKTMDPARFYAGIRAGEMPTTSMTTFQNYVDFFEPFLKDGLDIVYVGFSSGLSGSLNSSLIAREQLLPKYPDRKIYCVDSLSASTGQGLLVDAAVKMKDAGKSAEEIADWLEVNKFNLLHLVIANDLMHLHRGGRISKTSAVVGSLIGVKPLIYMNSTGHLISFDRVRGWNNGIKRLVDLIGEYSDGPLGTVAVSHSDCFMDAENTLDLMKEKYSVGDSYVNYIGPVIGSHVGTQTVALFFFGKHRPK